MLSVSPLLLIFLCICAESSLAYRIFSPRYLSRHVASVVIGISCSTQIVPPIQTAHAAEAVQINTETIQAIENVERVSKSLKYIQEDIASKGDASDIVRQVKFLVQNYKLKDNLTLSLNTIENQKRKSDAKAHAQNALEDLTQVYEYFSDEIDNMSGKKYPPREVLQFANDATIAAQKEFDLLLGLYPSDVMVEVNSKIEKEYQ